MSRRSAATARWFSAPGRARPCSTAAVQRSTVSFGMYRTSERSASRTSAGRVGRMPDSHSTIVGTTAAPLSRIAATAASRRSRSTRSASEAIPRSASIPARAVSGISASTKLSRWSTVSCPAASESNRPIRSATCPAKGIPRSRAAAASAAYTSGANPSWTFSRSKPASAYSATSRRASSGDSTRPLIAGLPTTRRGPTNSPAATRSRSSSWLACPCIPRTVVTPFAA